MSIKERRLKKHQHIEEEESKCRRPVWQCLKFYSSIISAFLQTPCLHIQPWKHRKNWQRKKNTRVQIPTTSSTESPNKSSFLDSFLAKWVLNFSVSWDQNISFISKLKQSFQAQVHRAMGREYIEKLYRISEFWDGVWELVLLLGPANEVVPSFDTD